MTRKSTTTKGTPPSEHPVADPPDGVGVGRDQELIDEFKELVDTITQQVISRAVEPEITQAVRDLRGSATASQRDFDEALERLKRLSDDAHAQREAFEKGFLNALDEAFTAQRSALDTLATDAESALETASAVVGAKKFEQTVSAARDLAASMRQAQETNTQRAEHLVRDVEERLTALNEGTRERQSELESSIVQQGARLDDMAAKIEELSHHLGGLGGYVDVFNEKSSELLRRHDQFVAKAVEQRAELSSEHEVRSRQLRWLFRAYLAAAVLLVLIVFGGGWYGLSHLNLLSGAADRSADALATEGQDEPRQALRLGPAAFTLAPVGPAVAGNHFGWVRCIGVLGCPPTDGEGVSEEASTVAGASVTNVGDERAGSEVPQAVIIHDGPGFKREDTSANPGESDEEQPAVNP